MDQTAFTVGGTGGGVGRSAREGVTGATVAATVGGFGGGGMTLHWQIRGLRSQQ